MLSFPPFGRAIANNIKTRHHRHMAAPNTTTAHVLASPRLATAYLVHADAGVVLVLLEALQQAPRKLDLAVGPKADDERMFFAGQ